MAYRMHGTEIGRNDTCRCGSGKKFKKCCIDKPYQSSPALLEDLSLGQQRIKEAGLEYPVAPMPAHRAKKIPLHVFAAMAVGTVVGSP